ncbi:MAG: MarR family transcriptional regulator [Chloroflexi bacterium]|nr:MarR family transcriptional regulator [Chloroflexota bacterium]
MRLARRLRAERPDDGVTLAKLNVLGHLQPVGALTAGEIAALERAQPQSLTRVLAELEAEGLITREQDQADRRRSILRITPEGTRELVRNMRRRDVWLASAMASALTPTERELLKLTAGLLDRLADS